MDSTHIVMIGLLVIILIVVVRMAMGLKDAERSASSVRRVLTSDALKKLESLRHPKEGFSYSGESLPEMVAQQIEQQRFLRDYSFPRSTVFAKLGNMLETCEGEAIQTPQCRMFEDWASRMM